jgi:hypothetical protein
MVRDKALGGVSWETENMACVLFSLLTMLLGEQEDHWQRLYLNVKTGTCSWSTDFSRQDSCESHPSDNPDVLGLGNLHLFLFSGAFEVEGKDPKVINRRA